MLFRSSACPSDIRDANNQRGCADDQVDRIAGLPSYRWAKDTLAEVQAKIAALNTEIADHRAVLADPAKQREIYKKELLALRKLSKVDR